MSFYDTLHKKNIIAKPGFNRWLVPPASIAIHLCIGSVYAWSMFNPALVKILGVVTSSGDDWSLGQVVWIFSVAIVSLGLAAAAYAGKWLEEVGPRMVGFVAACCWGGRFCYWLFGDLFTRDRSTSLTFFTYAKFGTHCSEVGFVFTLSWIWSIGRNWSWPWLCFTCFNTN